MRGRGWPEVDVYKRQAQFSSIGTIRPLTPASVTSATGLPAYLTQTSSHSASNHVMRPSIAFHAKYSVPGKFQTSPRMSRLVATSRRIEFVILRTASSLPVALHPASRRRSYLQLRGLGLPRHGLSPCGYRAFTGALIPANAGTQRRSVKNTLDPRFRGDDKPSFISRSLRATLH